MHVEPSTRAVKEAVEWPSRSLLFDVTNVLPPYYQLPRALIGLASEASTSCPSYDRLENSTSSVYESRRHGLHTSIRFGEGGTRGKA